MMAQSVEYVDIMNSANKKFAISSTRNLQETISLCFRGFQTLLLPLLRFQPAPNQNVKANEIVDEIVNEIVILKILKRRLRINLVSWKKKIDKSGLFLQKFTLGLYDLEESTT